MTADPHLLRREAMETLGMELPESYLKHAVVATSQYDDNFASMAAEILRLRQLITRRAEPVAVPAPTVGDAVAVGTFLTRVSEGAVPAAPPCVAFTIDARCDCAKCVARTENIYRMIGHCLNCGQRNTLMLFRAGDPATSRDCPRCGKWHGVEPQRLATDDEIPAAAPSAAAQTPDSLIYDTGDDTLQTERAAQTPDKGKK